MSQFQFSLVVCALLSSGCARKSNDSPNDNGTSSTDSTSTAHVPDSTGSTVQEERQPNTEITEPSPPGGEEEVAPEIARQVEVVAGPALIERIAGAKKKGTIVNAWASWCGPCRREFPMLVALRDNLAPRGIDIVFVSVDEPNSYGAAVEFAQTNGLGGPYLVASRPLGPFKAALHARWPGMLPATFLFDGDGKLRYFWGGPVYEQELVPIVDRFLAGEVVDGEAKFGLSPGQEFRQQ